MSVREHSCEPLEDRMKRRLDRSWQFGCDRDQMISDVNSAIVLLEEMRRIIEGRNDLSGDCDD
jgi:hypothetical protein